jgi:hypothetical protein
MQLLFDQRLSDKLVGRLADQFPDSEHVRNVKLHEADDRTVWEYARAHGCAIVSKMDIGHVNPGHTIAALKPHIANIYRTWWSLVTRRRRVVYTGACVVAEPYGNRPIHAEEFYAIGR